MQPILNRLSLKNSLNLENCVEQLILAINVIFTFTGMLQLFCILLDVKKSET